MPKILDKDDVDNMCDGLKSLISKNHIAAKAIIWSNMRRTREKRSRTGEGLRSEMAS